MIKPPAAAWRQQPQQLACRMLVSRQARRMEISRTKSSSDIDLTASLLTCAQGARQRLRLEADPGLRSTTWACPVAMFTLQWVCINEVTHKIHVSRGQPSLNLPHTRRALLTVPSTLTATGCTPLRMALYTVPKPPAPSRHSLPSERFRIWISAKAEGVRQRGRGCVSMVSEAHLGTASRHAAVQSCRAVPQPFPAQLASPSCSLTLWLDLPIAKQRGKLLR